MRRIHDRIGHTTVRYHRLAPLVGIKNGQFSFIQRCGSEQKLPIRQEGSHGRRGFESVVAVVAVRRNVALHRTAKLLVSSTGGSFGDAFEEELLESPDKIV